MSLSVVDTSIMNTSARHLDGINSVSDTNLENRSTVHPVEAEESWYERRLIEVPVRPQIVEVLLSAKGRGRPL